MRDFFDELMNGDSVVKVLMNNRKQAVKLAVIGVVILGALLLYVYRGGDEVELTDAAQQVSEEGAGSSGQGDGGWSGDGRAGGQSGDPQSGGSTPGAGTNPDGVVVGNGEIYVDIGGAVKKPMLARLPGGSRVEDAIRAAGGLTSDADLSMVNRAAVVSDGEKIYIPKKGEAGAALAEGGAGTGAAGAAGSSSAGAGGTAGVSGSGATGGLVNINTADLTQLQTVTGVGPATAQKIIDYRTQNGSFRSIEELKNVSGIGDKTFEKMRDQITV